MKQNWPCTGNLEAGQSVFGVHYYSLKLCICLEVLIKKSKREIHTVSKDTTKLN